MFKFLIKFCLFCTSYAAPLAVDADGWAAVSPASKKESESVRREGDDASIWVIFSKQLGDENFMVRFPDDPVYTYISPDEMKISSEKEGESHTLTILKAPSLESIEDQIKELFQQPEIDLAEVVRLNENTFDILYKKDEKWVAQRIFLSSQHLYVFQSENIIFHRENHQKFIGSLDVDLLRK